MRGKLTNVADRTERNLSYQMLVIAGHPEGFTVNGSRRGAIGRDISEGDLGVHTASVVVAQVSRSTEF